MTRSQSFALFSAQEVIKFLEAQAEPDQPNPSTASGTSSSPTDETSTEMRVAKPGKSECQVQ